MAVYEGVGIRSVRRSNGWGVLCTRDKGWRDQGVRIEEDGRLQF